MFKFVVIMLVFVSCAYIGFYFGEIYKSRSNELKEFEKALTFMNTEVLYSGTPLPLALINVSEKLQEPFSKVFESMSYMLEDGSVISVHESFKKSYIENKDEFNLKEEDLSIINDFFFSLGDSGVYGQEMIFNLALDGLKRRYLEAESECKINRKMYRILGVCVGSIIAIFFI